MRKGLCVFLAVALAGCAGPGDLAQEYGKNVRKVGLTPVYPPREEFQIGDVYFWSRSRTNANDSVSVYVDTMDWLREEADRFMKTRLVFENTTVSTSDGKPSRTARDLPGEATGLTTRGELALSNDLPRSLPIAAFPKITADAGFTAGVGFVQLLTAIGLAGASRTQVELNFNDVRTYWVPNVKVIDVASRRLQDIAFSNYTVGMEELERAAQARLGAGASVCGGSRECGASVITRVYLTRRIDYTYRNARIIAGAFRAAESGRRRSDVPAAPAVSINMTGADGHIQAETINAIRSELDRVTAADGQGASLRFEAWDARGMTFASEYMRPVVVGWDGISMLIQ